MNRKSPLFVVVLMAVVACGGGESSAEDTSPAPSTTAEAPTTTEVPAASVPETTTTSAGSAEGEGTQVCETMEADLEANQDVDVFDPATFEESSRRSLEAIESVAGQVPGDIQEEFMILVEANRDLVALFEEHDWDITAVPEDDSSFVRMGEPDVLAAAQAVIDFCQLEDPAGGGESGESGSIEELLPPQAGEVLSTEPIYIVESAAAFEDLVDHYQELLGRAPVNVSDEAGLRTASFVADYGDGRVALWVEETPNGILVEISA